MFVGLYLARDARALGSRLYRQAGRPTLLSLQIIFGCLLYFNIKAFQENWDMCRDIAVSLWMHSCTRVVLLNMMCRLLKLEHFGILVNLS